MWTFLPEETFSVDEVYEITNKVEKEILGVEEVETFYFRTGTGRRDLDNPDLISKISLDYFDKDERFSGKDGYEITSDIEALTKDHSGIIVRVWRATTRSTNRERS